MEEILRSPLYLEDYPKSVAEKYERLEILGRGAFGKVWLASRVTPPENDDDDEYVALKSIELKEEKAKIYAEREIAILNELRHPNVIRLIRAFPIHQSGQITTRWVALQLARGPNLQQLVNQRGALGLPLARLVSRQLIAAVSYLHGRAVLHRDIKPNNCILEDTQRSVAQGYDWYDDDAIWSDGPDGEEAAKNKWRLMLIDFGFARALEEHEILETTEYRKWSITNETNPDTLDTSERSEAIAIARFAAQNMGDAVQEAAKEMRRASISHFPVQASDEKIDTKPRLRRHSAISSFSTLPHLLDLEGGIDDNDGTEATAKMRSPRRRWSHSPAAVRNWKNRQSTARKQVRSMSALGTKAYAAPEIKELLRNKTESDFGKANAALTESVADYGMIVDAYSVGWTLRVILTGVPPTSTISEYVRKKEPTAQSAHEVQEVFCLCFRRKPRATFEYKIRDTPDIPPSATLLVTSLTKANPEERLTVREAQVNPWIRGGEDEEIYDVAQGDYPSRHGDPVVPLTCAAELSKLVQSHHAL